MSIWCSRRALNTTSLNSLYVHSQKTAEACIHVRARITQKSSPGTEAFRMLTTKEFTSCDQYSAATQRQYSSVKRSFCKQE
jgi:hypothetical protein